MRAAYDANQGCEYAHGAAIHFFKLLIFREQAGIAGRIFIALVEHTDLAVELDRCAGNQGHAIRNAGAIDRMPRGEIVAAIQYHGCIAYQFIKAFAGYAFLQCDDLYGRIDFSQRLLSR